MAEPIKDERQVTQAMIAERIGVKPKQVEYIISRWGHEKIVELLEIRGHYVWYELVNEYTKFWELV